jgi:hypothetical protein
VNDMWFIVGSVGALFVVSYFVGKLVRLLVAMTAIGLLVYVLAVHQGWLKSPAHRRFLNQVQNQSSEMINEASTKALKQSQKKGRELLEHATEILNKE